MSGKGCFLASTIFATVVFALPAAAADDCDVLSGDAAIAACTRSIQSGKFKGHDQAINYFNRGLKYYANKDDLDRAIADYSAAIQLDSKYAKAYNYRAIAYREKGDFSRSIPDFDEAIRVNPKYTAAYIGRGYNYQEKGEPERATADYNEAILLDPQNPLAYMDLGSVHESKGEFDLAIADYNEAIRLMPRFTMAYRNRGRARLYGGNVARAFTDLSQATELNPKDAYSQLWLDIVGQRNGAPSRLAQSISAVDMTRWPAPVIRLFLGQLTPAAVLAAADDPNAKRKAEQICEANLYAGEFFLRQDKSEAARLFRVAVNDCPIQNFTERNAAKTELKLLGDTNETVDPKAARN
jgi:lipoprotein NlpI